MQYSVGILYGGRHKLTYIPPEIIKRFSGDFRGDRSYLTRLNLLKIYVKFGDDPKQFGTTTETFIKFIQALQNGLKHLETTFF